MRLMNLLAMLKARTRATQLAADLARLAQPQIAERIGVRVHGMSMAEARGYVRARSRLVLEDRLDAMRGIELRRADLRAAVIEEALERTITWALSQKVLAAPSRLRKAA